MGILDQIRITIKLGEIGLTPYSDLSLRYARLPRWLKWIRPKARKEYKAIELERMVQLLDHTIQTGMKYILT